MAFLPVTPIVHHTFTVINSKLEVYQQRLEKAIHTRNEALGAILTHSDVLRASNYDVASMFSFHVNINDAPFLENKLTIATYNYNKLRKNGLKLITTDDAIANLLELYMRIYLYNVVVIYKMLLKIKDYKEIIVNYGLVFSLIAFFNKAIFKSILKGYVYHFSNSCGQIRVYQNDLRTFGNNLITRWDLSHKLRKHLISQGIPLYDSVTDTGTKWIVRDYPDIKAWITWVRSPRRFSVPNSRKTKFQPTKYNHTGMSVDDYVLTEPTRDSIINDDKLSNAYKLIVLCKRFVLHHLTYTKHPLYESKTNNV